MAACTGGGGGGAIAPVIAPGSGSTAAPGTSPSPVKTTAPTPTPVPTATPTAGSSPSAACAGASGGNTTTIGSSGGTISASAAPGTFTETFSAGQLASSTSVSLGYISSTTLPAPLLRAVHVDRNGARTPMFVQGAGNTYVLAFCTSFTGSAPSSGVSLSGTGVVPTTIAVGTQLNIAKFQNGTWADVGTAIVTASGNFASTTPTVALPGILTSGSYLVYVPATGTNTAQINLGFAILADDGLASTHGLQFVQVESTSGVAAPTPATTFFPISQNATDLDGQSLTPDASRGALVDGGNTVFFFSGIPQGQFNLATGTVDVTAYGGDGDSIASLPSGDEVVVSADDGGALAVISGILAGNPVVADTIPQATAGNFRDGLVISADGKVLLSRGYAGIDVFSIAPVAAHAGSTGTGTTSYAFTLKTTLAAPTTVSNPFLEDGRDGMAISPADSSRAVVVGTSGSGPEVQLLTNLTGSSPVVTSLAPRFPIVQRKLGALAQAPEPTAHRAPFALTPTVGTDEYAVAITPDGTTAYVSTDAGIITIGGVNTGTLTQIGGVYAPTLSLPGGGTCTLSYATSIGILPDGKYLVAEVNPFEGSSCSVTAGTTNATQGNGVLVTIPIGANDALGAPVGQLNQIVTPVNDQMLVH